MRLSATGLVLGCVLFLGAGTAFGNLITNGNFSGGGAGVQTDYTPAFSNTGPGQVLVTATPIPWNPAYTYPTGTGDMLVADGATSYSRAWYQDGISLTAGTTYYASFDASSLTTAGSQYADLGLYVRTNPFTSTLVAAVLLDSNVGVWKSAVGSFTPSANGLVEFFIGNLNISGTGNAFAVDNISVHVPEPSSLALLGVGSLVGLGVYARRRRKHA